MRARRTFAAAAGPAELDLPEAARDVLRGGVGAAVVELDGARLRVGAVPLVRREPNGELGRCIRVAGSGTGRVVLTLTSGEALIDRAELTLGAHPASCHLYAPERERRLELRILRADGPESVHGLEMPPHRHWTVFLVHHSHLDIGYTDLQPVVLRHHRAYLDSVLDLAAATGDWADDARFRWTVEGNLPLQEWLRERPAARVAELVGLVREGRIEVCALPFTLNVEACAVDELAQQLRWARTFAAEHQVEVVTAMQTDVPGHGHGLPGILSTSGVRYLDVAHNYAARATPYLTGGFDLPRLFRWGGGGGEVLVWHTDSPRGVAYLEGNLLGLAESVDLASELLPEYLLGLAENGYPYGGSVEALGLPSDLELPSRPYPLDILHLRLQGTIADNAAPSIAPAEIVRAWNERYASPRLRLSTAREFFAAAEAQAGELERFSGDWTSWWLDGIGSSARTLGANRRAQSKLRTAQTLHVAADVTAGVQPGWPARSDRLYDLVALFDEHTWGAAFPDGDAEAGRSAGEQQWQLKASYALEAEADADALLAAAVARFAARRQPLDVAVVNVCPFARTDRVEVFVPASIVPAGAALEVHTPGGEVVPSITVQAGGAEERNRPQGQTISFVAREVPPVGYRAYELRPSNGVQPAPQSVTGNVLENDHYRVEIDPAEGCVASLFDVELGRELVASGSAFGFGQYVYDRYLESLRPTQRATPGTGLASSALPAAPTARVLATRSTPTGGVATSRTSSPVEERLTVRLWADGAELLETTFRLVHGVRRLELTHRLVKRPVAAKESVFFAFPFAARDPVVSYELVGGPAPAAGPRVPGSASHGQAIRHWVALEEADATLAWSSLEAPLLELRNLYSPYPPYGPTVAEDDPGLVASWAMNNVWDTNFPLQQGGEVRFGYAVASAAPGTTGSVAGMRTAASLTQPLVGFVGALAGEAGSFCAFDRDDVELVGLAASTAGHDFVLRLRSQARARVRVRIDFPDLRVATVRAGSFFEADLVDVADGAGATVELDPGKLTAVAVGLQPSA